MQEWHNKLRCLPSVFLIMTVVPRTGTQGAFCWIFLPATLKVLLPSGLFKASPKLRYFEMKLKEKMEDVWASDAHVQVSSGELGNLSVDSAGKAGCFFLSCSGSLEFFSQSCCSSAVNAAQGRKCRDGPQWWQHPGLGRLRIITDPSLEFTGWRALQPTPFHFIVVIWLRSGEMLIYVIHFIPVLPTCSYT